MADESKKLRKELEDFKQSTSRLSDKIKGVGDIWKDENYASLSSQIKELAKSSKIVIESGERACSSMEKFFNIASEDV